MSQRNRRCVQCSCSCLALVTLAFGVLIALSCEYPRYTVEDDAAQLAQLAALQEAEAGPDTLTVMSFNMRLDAWEPDENNHFTRRVYRVANTFERVAPQLVGLQEPFGPQLLHQLSELPDRYAPVGYDRGGVVAAGGGIGDIAHPSRHDDFKIAFVYDTEVLDLVEQDYLWLSETPRRERSRSWGSRGERCANFALFELRAAAASTGPPRRIIAVNTHLDVWSEPARRHQAALVARTVREWRQRFPDAVVVGFGDFNSAPGQPPHRILTAELDDAWLVCEATAACTTNDFAATFHGWMGSKVNTYAARLVSLFAFWMHGLGAEFPAHVPRTLREALRAAKIGLTTEPSSSVGDAMPAWPWLHRMHVDWILLGASRTTSVVPRTVFVADVRDKDYSSDHFPVVAVLHLGAAGVESEGHGHGHAAR